MQQRPISPVFIHSRANPWFKNLRKLAHDSAAYRKQGQIWLEGDHLCRAALARGVSPNCAVFSASVWRAGISENLYEKANKLVVLDDALFADISPLQSAAEIAYLLDASTAMGQSHTINPKTNSVVLDRIQDAGNVGSILRSASAMGFSQVIALHGTAALWSPKVLRSGMGAHFGLQLFEGCAPEVVQQLQIPVLITHLQADALLHNTALPTPCAWVFGHEGQGVQTELLPYADKRVRIQQPGGEESLNVAAAAAICLHTSSVQHIGRICKG